MMRTLLTKSLAVAGVVASIVALATWTGGSGKAAAQGADERIFVVDANYVANPYDARIFVIEQGPDGREVRILRTTTEAYQPRIVPSPDGRRLYVSYGSLDASGRLLNYIEALDVTSGLSEYRVRAGERWMSPLPGFQFAESALSVDGSWLFQMNMTFRDDEYTEYYVRVLDTATGRFLPGVVDVPMCVAGRLVPSLASRRRLKVACSHSQDVRSFTLSEDGASTGPPVFVSTQGDTPSDAHPAVAFWSGGPVLTTISQDGSYVSTLDSAVGVDEAVKRDAVDRVGRQLAGGPRPLAGPAREGAESRADWMRDRVVTPQPPTASTGGGVVYLMVGMASQPRERREIVVLDALRLDRLRTLALSKPVSSIALSIDGNRLIATVPGEAELLVIDAQTGEEVATIGDVGATPVFVAVAPRR